MDASTYLFLYAAKGLNVEEIAERVASNWEDQGNTLLLDPEMIKDSISTMAQHLQMWHEDFDERDKRAQFYKELGITGE